MPLLGSGGAGGAGPGMTSWVRDRLNRAFSPRSGANANDGDDGDSLAGGSDGDGPFETLSDAPATPVG